MKHPSVIMSDEIRSVMEVKNAVSYETGNDAVCKALTAYIECKDNASVDHIAGISLSHEMQF